MQKVWIIWSPLLYFNFKSLMDKISASFIRFHCIPHGSGVIFSESWNFYKLKRVDLISGGNRFWRKWISPPFLLYVNFKSLIDAISSSFIRFQCNAHESGVFFAESWNFYKLKRGTEFLGETNFAESLNYLVPPSVCQF